MADEKRESLLDAKGCDNEALPTTVQDVKPAHRSRRWYIPRESTVRWMIRLWVAYQFANLFFTVVPQFWPAFDAVPARRGQIGGYLRDAITKNSQLAPPCFSKKLREGRVRKHLTQHEAEEAFLAVPDAESARAISHSFTGTQHIAGSENDRLAALRVKSQWESLLGLADSGENNVFDAGSLASKRALYGTCGGKVLPTSYWDRLRWWRCKIGQWTRRQKHRRQTKNPRVWVDTYYPLLNYPVSHSLQLNYANTSQSSFVAALTEDVLEEDPTSAHGPMTFHGFAKSGQAKGQLVYVGRGTKQDFETLKAQGVDFKGKIVLAQYGGVFRGLKVKEAAEAGAIACLIYTDPIEDGDITVENGYEAYPHGPARQPSSVQRGSAQFLSIAPGDPLTPGRPAYKNTKRLKRDDDILTIPSIPSFPISYKDALPLLRSLNGHGIKLEDRPDFKQGGLRYEGVEYYTGPGPDTVELNLKMDDKVTPIWNTMLVIPGALKDEIVVVGNHNDAWTFGAGDPNSGTASVHEIVKGFGKLLESGWKPLRTIVVASWDAEEYGLIGSTEWGEDHKAYLKSRVVAYLNVDMSASGTGYGVRASPSLAGLFKLASDKVDDPLVAGRSLLSNLAAESRDHATLEEGFVGQAIGKNGDLKIAPLGSGSDFTVFLAYIGIASSDLSFSRTQTDPVYHYHSNYDSAYWMDKFGDPTFTRHAAIAKVLGYATLKLADSLILPLDVTDYAKELESYLGKVEQLAASYDDQVDLAPLSAVITQVQDAARDLHVEIEDIKKRFEEIVQKSAAMGPLAFLSGNSKQQLIQRQREDTHQREKHGKDEHHKHHGHHEHRGHKHGKHSRHSHGELRKLLERAHSVNKRLQGFEGTFIDEKGLPFRPWYKSLVIAPGRDLGYGATSFPGVTEALTLDRDPKQATEQVTRLVRALERTVKLLRSK